MNVSVLFRIFVSLLAAQMIFFPNRGAADAALDKQKDEEGMKLGEEASQKVIDGIRTKLTKEMAKNLVGSIGYCHENAIPLTTKSEKKNSQVIEIKRTSLKLRNHNNMPDAAEEKLLKEWAKKGAPEFALEWVSEKEFRYYRPLKVQAMCLTCHGKPDGELKNAILKKYPMDDATGYKEGDLRGLIRVSIKPKTISSK